MERKLKKVSLGLSLIIGLLALFVGGYLKMNGSFSYEVSDVSAYAVSTFSVGKSLGKDDLIYNFSYSVNGKERRVQGFSSKKKNHSIEAGEKNEIKISRSIKGSSKTLVLTEEILEAIGLTLEK